MVSSCFFVYKGGKTDSISEGEGSFVQGSGKTVSERRDLPAFKSLIVDGAIDLKFIQDAKESTPVLSITCPEEDLPLIKTTVTPDGTLHIRKEDSRRHSNVAIGMHSNVTIRRDGIKMELRAPELYSVIFNGSGDFEASEFTTSRLDLCLNGSGDFDIDGLTVEGNLDMEVNGSGDIAIDGLSVRGNVKAEVIGSGDIDLSGLEAAKVTSTVVGSGDITLAGKTGTADLKVSGSGSIEARSLEYSSIDTAVSGSGSIRKK